MWVIIYCIPPDPRTPTSLVIPHKLKMNNIENFHFGTCFCIPNSSDPPFGFQVDVMRIDTHEVHKALLVKVTVTHHSAPDQGEDPYSLNKSHCFRNNPMFINRPVGSPLYLPSTKSTHYIVSQYTIISSSHSAYYPKPPSPLTFPWCHAVPTPLH